MTLKSIYIAGREWGRPAPDLVNESDKTAAIKWIGKYFLWRPYGVRKIKKTQKNFPESFLFLEPTSGFGPETPSLPF